MKLLKKRKSLSLLIAVIFLFVMASGNVYAADTQNPTTPTGLTATAVSTNQINLSWNASSDDVGVTGYKILRNGTQIATVTGSGSGGTWSNVTPPGMAGKSAISAVVDPVRPSDIYCISYDDGCYKSTDYGQTWTKISGNQISSGCPWYTLIDPNPNRNPSTPPTIYTILGYGQGGVWKSVDGGYNWTNVWDNNVYDGATNIAASIGGFVGCIQMVSPTSPQHLIATMHDLNTTYNGIFESTNGGGRWDLKRTPFQFQSHGDVLFGVTETNWCVAHGNTSTGGPYCHVTTNSGATWGETTGFQGMNMGRAYYDSGSTKYVSSDTGSAKTTNGGVSFTKYNGLPSVWSLFATTSTKLYALTATVPTTFYSAPLSNDDSWTSIAVPSALNHISTFMVQTNNGSNNILVTPAWETGIWRFVEGATPPPTTFNNTGLNSGTQYTYTVVAYDAVGNNSAQSTSASATTQTPDTQAPSVPTGLTATTVSSSQINLNWTASTDNVGVTGYKIYRGGTQIATATGTTYSNTGLLPTTQYSYTVSANDAAGNNSAQSTSASATTQTGAANVALNKQTTVSTIEGVGTPGNSAVDGNMTSRWASTAVDPSWIYVDLGSQVSINQVKLYWEGAYGKSYKIQVSNDASSWSDVFATTTGDGATDDISFTATNARFVRMYGTQRATQYGYSLYEFEVYTNGGGGGDTQAPTVPTGLSATAVSSSQINLSWTASTDNSSVTGYKIYRGSTQIATATGTTYSNTGLTASTQYTYTVSAYDAASNNSVQSTSASATTQAPSAYTDDFNGPLGAAWTWGLPLSGPTNSFISGNFRLAVPNTNIYDSWTGIDNSPRLTRTDMGSGDWSIETKLNLATFTAGANFHSGFIVKLGTNDYFFWGERFGNSLRLDRTGAVINNITTYTNTSVYLKISKVGTTYTFYYKANSGDAWTSAGTSSATNAVQSVGLFSKTWTSGNAITTDFEYFNLTNP